jgi:tetratricopeptide (TPR) repeat protein
VFDYDLAHLATGLDEGIFRRVWTVLTDSCLIEVIHGSPKRFRVLEPLRSHIARTVGTSLPTSTLSRVATYCHDQARALERGVPSDGLATSDGDVAELLTWVRLALEHYEESGDADGALRLTSYLDTTLYSRGWWKEKNELLDIALSIPGKPTVARARALTLRGRHGLLSEFDLPKIQRAREIALALGNANAAAYATSVGAIHLWWQGRLSESLSDQFEAMEIFRANGLEWGEFEALKFAGLAQVQLGQIDSGLRQQRQSLEGHRRQGRTFGVAHGLGLLGHCQRFLGNEEAAHVCFSEAAEICAGLGNRATAIHVHIGLASITCEQGNPDATAVHVAQALSLSRAAQIRAYEPWAWTVAMRSAADAGRMSEAKRCAAQAFEVLHHAPGGDAVRLALVLADIALEVGDPQRAARLAGAASVIDNRPEIPLIALADRLRRERLTASLNAILGEQTMDFEQGRLCSPVEAAGSFIR